MTKEVYKHNKNQDIPNLFLEISQRYCKIVWMLSACLAQPIGRDSITMQKTLMFIRMQKLNSSLISFLRYCKNIAYLF